MLNSREEHPVRTAELRARAAAESVGSRFGHRLWGLPGTHLGAVRFPAGRGASPWHYWWQAHYLDALVDATLRESTERAGEKLAVTARRLLRSIYLRNGLRWTNSYYDDMAWLALAADRFRQLGRGGGQPGSPLERALRSAYTPELGGGLYWNTDRDFKNTPATGPAALLFARRGDAVRAQELVDWLQARLQDPATGLFQDGIRLTGGGERLIPTVYTYNQGPVLGALLELGGPDNLSSAENLIIAVDKHLTSHGVLRTHGGGDGGLFTGILARYLAVAAGTPTLPSVVRRTAGALVTTAAETLWAGRAEPDRGQLPLETTTQGTTARSGAGRRRSPVPGALEFPAGTGADTGTGGSELSTQLQAWMILEAAYRVAAGVGTEAESTG